MFGWKKNYLFQGIFHCNRSCAARKH